MEFEFRVLIRLESYEGIPHKFNSVSFASAKRIVRRICSQHPELSKMEFSDWSKLLGMRHKDKNVTDLCASVRHLKDTGLSALFLRWKQNHEDVIFN